MFKYLDGLCCCSFSCVESVKNFQLQLVAEKACMVYVRKYRCTGAVMGLQFKLLT